MHASKEAETYSDLTPQQKKSGLAAWLGWLFDGLDMHLYTLVAIPFVAQLMSLPQEDKEVSVKASLIQGAFLVGWAVGGAFFGRIGDLIGRSRALVLTILTYACFTGLSYFAQTWWHLLGFRFLAALGIGGEWAVGASLLAETWPRRWRPWMAAVLQTAVNCGVLLACLAGFFLADHPARERVIFLVGIFPALITLWIRKAVPEPEVWAHAHEERKSAGGIPALFRPPLLRTTLIVVTVCALGLTAHWALMFWHSAHLRALAKAANWAKTSQDQIATQALYLLMFGSIVGNFFAGWIARSVGYARAVGIMFTIYFGAMLVAYGPLRSPESVLWFLPTIGLAQGAFALFTMCLPPLFPTLLRTTGAGFCYNIGRIIAAAGTVIFGLWATVGTGPTAICDHRLALFYAAWLFLPAALVSWFLLPEPEKDAV
ncbi:MAG TPA: MFS transporter [Chthoniobacteraceae bacterium]|nr:MFS transporter [Chthoniobacteraceae bacterium]